MVGHLGGVRPSTESKFAASPPLVEKGYTLNIELKEKCSSAVVLPTLPSIVRLDKLKSTTKVRIFFLLLS